MGTPRRGTAAPERCAPTTTTPTNTATATAGAKRWLLLLAADAPQRTAARCGQAVRRHTAATATPTHTAILTAGARHNLFDVNVQHGEIVGRFRLFSGQCVSVAIAQRLMFDVILHHNDTACRFRNVSWQPPRVAIGADACARIGPTGCIGRYPTIADAVIDP